MILLPPHLFKRYRSYCAGNGVKDSDFADYLKWLRYFLDFCEKYKVVGDESERTRLFLDKLQQKGQSEQKRIPSQSSGVILFRHDKGWH